MRKWRSNVRYMIYTERASANYISKKEKKREKKKNTVTNGLSKLASFRWIITSIIEYFSQWNGFIQQKNFTYVHETKKEYNNSWNFTWILMLFSLWLDQFAVFESIVTKNSCSCFQAKRHMIKINDYNLKKWKINVELFWNFGTLYKVFRKKHYRKCLMRLIYSHTFSSRKVPHRLIKSSNVNRASN